MGYCWMSQMAHAGLTWVSRAPWHACCIQFPAITLWALIQHADGQAIDISMPCDWAISQSHPSKNDLMSCPRMPSLLSQQTPSTTLKYCNTKSLSKVCRADSSCACQLTGSIKITAYEEVGDTAPPKPDHCHCLIFPQGGPLISPC